MKVIGWDIGASGQWRCIYPIVLIIAAVATTCFADEWVRVKWVVDGDTVVLQDGRHVRYIGIDTPEIDHKNQRAEPLGYEAMAFNRCLCVSQRRASRQRGDRKKGICLGVVSVPQCQSRPNICRRPTGSHDT